MRVLLVALLLATLALPTAIAPSSVPGGECGRGPYETVLPVDALCCAWGYWFFCFQQCDVWVRVPVLGGYMCANPTA